MTIFPMIDPKQATLAGLLPVRNKPVRFAVGAPDGLTSNSWKVRSTRSGVYITCRDNFQHTKVSLHLSTDPRKASRWRMGFSNESLIKIAHLLSDDQNRAWDVWDEPLASLPGSVVAFKLVFPTSELAVLPEMRPSAAWDKVIHIEAAPAGKLTVLTLFVTEGEPDLNHGSEPSFRLASFTFGPGRHAQLIAHSEPESDFSDLMNGAVSHALAGARSKGVRVPDQAYGYFLGRQPDGCRYIFGARLHCP